MVKLLLILFAVPAFGATFSGVGQLGGAGRHVGISPWDRMARQASNEVATLIAANGTTRTMWTDGIPPVGDSNWAKTIDWSGFSRSGSANLALITRKHGITCAHAFSPLNAEMVFRSLDGQQTTNLVVAVTNPISDIRVCTLASNVPAFIEPFQVFSTNWWNYASNATHSTGLWLGVTNPLATVYIRNNTASLNLAAAWQFYIYNDGYILGYLSMEERLVPSPWVTDSDLYVTETLTGGDSGGPMFLILDGHAMFLGAFHYSNRSGPCVSYPPHYRAIQSAIAPDEMALIDISLYGL